MYATFEYDEVQLNGSQLAFSMVFLLIQCRRGAFDSFNRARAGCDGAGSHAIVGVNRARNAEPLRSMRLLASAPKISPVPYFDKSIKHD